MRTTSLVLALAAVGATSLVSTTALAASDCGSLWAQEFAEQHGITDCKDPAQTVACDKNDDGDTLDAGDVCTVAELLKEFHKDPLRGELVEDPTDVDGDGLFVEYSADIVPGGVDGNLSARVVPLCADGSSSCPDQELRCVDGTRPVYYIDPADDPTSDKWLFTFQGGGSCGRTETETGGENCWDRYQTADGRNQMSTSVQNGGVLLGLKRSIKGSGILDDRASNNFNDFHRVKVHKCTFDRGLGQVARTDLSGADREVDPDTLGKPSAVLAPHTAATGEFNLPFHGWFVMQAILADLDTGPSIEVFEDGTTVTVPSIGDADLVLLAGHSGGSMGVVHRADASKALLATIAPDAEVLALLDARGKTHIDQEAYLTDGGTGAGTGAGVNFYDYATGAVDCDSALGACLPASRVPADTSYSDWEYTYDHTIEFGGSVGTQMAYRKDRTDDSCTAIHSGSDAWRCNTPDHVMYHHMEVPFFLRQSQQDESHLNKAPDWADDRDYRWVQSEYTDRVVSQVLAFRNERNKPWANRDWEERVYGWAQPTDRGLGVFMPDTTKHAGLFNSNHFFEVYLDDGTGSQCTSYHDALWGWLFTGEELWIEGVGTTVSGAGVCP